MSGCFFTCIPLSSASIAAARSRFYDYLLLEEYERLPRLFILSTHLINEAAKLFEDVFIIHEGSLLHQDAETLRLMSFLITGTKKAASFFWIILSSTMLLSIIFAYSLTGGEVYMGGTSIALFAYVKII
jgi:hypothetical protein